MSHYFADSNHAAGDNNTRLNLWHLPEWTFVGSMPGYSGIIFSVAFSPDGRFVASGDQSGVHFWRVLLSPAAKYCPSGANAEE